MRDSRSKQTGSSQWPVTDWSDLARVAVSVGKDADHLGRLIGTYHRPLRRFLDSAFPGLKDQFDEILQDFSQDKLLRQGWLARADRRRGRFRDFLKTSLKNFVNDRLRKVATAPLSLDALPRDLSAEECTDEIFDMNWIQDVLAETLRRMELDCRDAVKNQPTRPLIWEVFRLRVVQPIFSGTEPVGYRELVHRCGIRSPFEAHNLLATSKRMFLRHLGAVIGEYEGRGGAIKEEVQHFKDFLDSIRRRKQSGNSRKNLAMDT